MKWFGELLERLMKGDEESELATIRGIKEFAALLLEQPEIRFYVDGTPNFGHQASTIYVMKRLIDRFDYMGAVRIVYQDAAGGMPTPDKLALLLTGLVPADITTTTIEYGTCQSIAFLPWNNRATLNDGGLGFTGGADNTEVNLAKELKVSLFLRLQPFLWKTAWGMGTFVPNTIEFNDDRAAVNLASISTIFPLLASRYLKDPTQTVPVQVWDWYIKGQKYAPLLAACTANAKALLDALVVHGSARLWPVYGLHHFEPNGRDILLTLAALALLSQTQNQAPIVLALLNTFKSLDFSLVDAFMTGNEEKIKEIITADYADPMFPAPSKQMQVVNEMIEVIKKLVKDLAPQKRCTFLDHPTPEALDKAVAALGQNQFLLAVVGPVPQEVFNALYSKANFPPVFEGQGTSSLVVSLGVPYLQTPKAGFRLNNYPDVPPRDPMEGAVSVASAKCSQDLGERLNIYIGKGDPNQYRLVLEELAKWTTLAYTSGSEFQVYFNSLREFFQNDLHDKILLGCVALNGVTKPVLGQVATSGVRTRVANKDTRPLTLDQIYAALNAAWSNGRVDLLGALPGTALAAFYTPVVGTSLPVAIARDNIVEQKDAKGTVTAVLLRNGVTAAFGTPFGMELEFSAAQGPVRSRMQCRSSEVWRLDGVPWIAFDAPGFDMEVPEASLPVVGGAVGSVHGTGLTLEIRYPVDGTWVITGSFASPYPGIATFYAMAGGVNLVQSMPPPLDTLFAFGLSRAQLVYDVATTRITSLLLEFQTSQPWIIVSTPKLQVQPRVTAVIYDPASLNTRTVTYKIVGDFNIGKGTITIGAQYPDFQLVGALTNGVIDLNDLAKLFGVAVDLASAVTRFDLFVQPPTGAYSVATTLTADWPISVGGTTLFTITGLGFNVQGGSSNFLVFLSGTTVILPDTPRFAVELTLTAAYSNPGWVFSGEQASGEVSLGALLEYYIGWNVGQDLGIDGLRLTVATQNSNWAFTGKTADPWEVPFISGLSVRASLLAGYGTPPAAAVAGCFARVETRWIWENIDIIVWFDYNPAVNQYGITWGILEGIVSGPDPVTQDWTATLRFKHTTTLGSMIETMVSWITGSKFGLESPWDFLNAIPLSGLALKYTFNKANPSRNKVTFSVGIGPINLGFAQIDSIDVGYESTGADRGVMVSLEGQFFWQTDPSKPLTWDASKPGTAPAPPGNGNKYLDVRLLAMGQHITLPCFATADSVQKAIACMATLPDPTPGEIPPVRFDPQSAWLIGTDFGVLKFDTGQPATRGSGPAVAGYLLTLQAVFNDPHLYALRVALAGPAAKVFKGLDFQIMYRQVSDSVGVYQAEITLPDLMRHLTVGAYSITLPVFGIAIYTNGDFQVDIGFPWNENFARSFTIEAIIPPGIPVLGSAGFYFGKLSSASTNRVPTSTLGTFNPVLVFGFGLQVGFGKSIEYGILSAGFSVTVVGILEGVIAKWNPYRLTDASREPSSQVQGDYYFWLRGTVGIIGKVYGSVDFAIVKASVNLTVKLLLQLTYESYVSITITVIASVEVSVRVRINLGLFKISLSFSFAMRLKETFTIDNTGVAPWVGSGQAARGLLRAPVEQRLSSFSLARARSFAPFSAPNWGNLQAGSTVDLWGYLVPGLTAARDEWALPGQSANQLPCWVALLLIDSMPPAGQDGEASKLKASGGARDTSFEVLAKMVLRWAVAALHGPMTPDQVDAFPVPITTLDRLADEVLASTDMDPAPIPLEAVQSFLQTQFLFKLRVPPADQDISAEAAYFPAPPQLRLTIPAYGTGYPGVKYDFGNYNTLSQSTLGELRDWFDQLAVQVEREQPANAAQHTVLLAEAAPLSMAGWMFSDYFLLLARQMVKAAQDALRDFKYPLTGNETPDQVVAWVNQTGKLAELYTRHDVFAANPQHLLAAGKTLTIGVTVAVTVGDTFTSLGKRFDGEFPGSALAGANASNPVLIQAGATILFPGHAPYTSVTGDTLVSIAAHYAVQLNELLAGSDILSADGLLKVGAAVLFPFTSYATLQTDTFASVARLPIYAGGFDAAALATANAGRSVLREGAKVEYPGKSAYTVQPRDTLGDVANAFAVALTELLTQGSVLNQLGLIAPVASLTIPTFPCTTVAGDDLTQVASRFGISIAVLSDQPVNGGVPGLFDAATYLDLPHLPQFPVGELLAEVQRTGALQHLSGMASSYTMHGMRFPTRGSSATGGEWSIVPNAMGMWVREVGGTLTLPPQAGLYALTGQQFPLPTLGTDTFSATFDRQDGIATSWLRFVDAHGAAADHLTLSVMPGTSDAVRIAQVAQTAQTRLAVPLDALGAGEMFHAGLATYPLTSTLQWQHAGTVALPYGGTPPSGTQGLRLLRIPDALAALPDPATRAVDPRFSLRVARYDEATGGTQTAKVGSYGWASTIDFTIRRIPPVAGSPASMTTYEVVGAGGTSIVLLERMLSQLGTNDSAYEALLVGYAPDGASSSAQGVQTDEVRDVTFGIAQVNLSTETRPAAVLTMAAMLEKVPTQQQLTLLNPPSEFVRLLWEASITRAGGFFLYYYDRAAGRGLPDRIFNDRNETSLTLIVIYAKPLAAADQDRVAGYMNAVVTAEALDTGNAVLFAESAPMPATVTAASQTLLTLAHAWFSDPADVAEANASLALRAGAPLRVSNGVYQAPPGGIPLQDVATRFGTSVQQLNEANPLWKGLPDPLQFPAAICVPDMTLTAGTSAHTASLADVAAWYGEPVAGLAAHNERVPGLFALGAALTIPGGPRVRAASVQPGVQALAALRPAPPPVDGTSASYGTDLLLNNFSLLNQQLLENAYFRGSNFGLPAGPTTAPAADAGNDKVRLVTPVDQVEDWDFGQALPYARFAKCVALTSGIGLPRATDSPYAGIGGILQVSFAWQDYYGNALSTPLSDPQVGDRAPYNDGPLFIGYTDPLIALSQWPSVASSWQMVPGSSGQIPRLQLALGFDPSRYQGLLQAWASTATTLLVVFTDLLDAASVSEVSRWQLLAGTVESASLGPDGKTVALTVSALTEGMRCTVVATDLKAKVGDTRYSGQASFDWRDDPATRSSTVQQNAAQDLHVLTQLYYQLTDPAGIAFSLQSTLFLGDGAQPGNRPLTQAQVDALMDWLFGTSGAASVYAFVLDRSRFGTATQPPALTFALELEMKAEHVNPAQVFNLWLSFTLERTRGAVLPGLETTAGIRLASTRVAPLQDVAGTTGSTLGLVTFATAFESALSTPGSFRLKVATGVDRTLPPATGGAALWAVRLGLAAGQAISYAITNAGNPAVFAPQPASNQLISRTEVAIYDYTTGKGISTSVSRRADFTDVDLDTWCAQAFAAVDGVLAPQFTAPMQIVGALRSSDYLQQILKGKKALANLAKLWMVPVFADATADPAEAREAFYQQLLVRLAAAYTTRAAVEFSARVSADVVEPVANLPPRLFGPVARLGPSFDAATVEAHALTSVLLLFSEPLDPAAAGNVANYALSGGIGVLLATVAGAVVTLQLVLEVQPGQTTVTVSHLTDVLGRAVRAPLTHIVTTGRPAVLPGSTLGFSAPKLTLQSGAARSLTYLVSAPETVRGTGGEVVPYVQLDMEYQGSQIEHQIGTLPGIKDYEASTWLRFVIPNAEALRVELGSFAVPMVLRAFPTTPTLAAQHGTPSNDLNSASLGELKQWDYAFTYSLPFHYPQDRVHGAVEFNLRQQMMTLMSFPDAFAQLAEFVTVFPQVNQDLVAILAEIDATVDPSKDQLKIDNAAIALQSFIQLVDDLVAAAGGGNASSGGGVASPLRFEAQPPRLTGDQQLSYAFYVEEASARVGDTEGALVISLSGTLPAGVASPVVEVDPAAYQVEAWPPTGDSQTASDRLCYVYKRRAGPGPEGTYLTAEQGQTIADRTVRLPTLDILQRQDAWSTVWMERNRELVPGRPSASAFVYTTPKVRFASPLYPTNDATAEVDVAAVPSGQPVLRPLEAHLAALFADLLAHDTQPQIVVQVEVTYEYALNPALARITLPILMQAPLTVTVTGTGTGTLANMISAWSSAIQTWFSIYVPACGGTLCMDLTLMSNLTVQPMPLLRLRRLTLPIQWISPPLMCR